MSINRKTTNLIDCLDELHQVNLRMRILEHVMIFTPEFAASDRGRDAVAQLSQDVSDQIGDLIEKYSRLDKEERSGKKEHINAEI